MSQEERYERGYDREMIEHQPIPPEIQRLAKEHGIDIIKNLNTGDHRNPETGEYIDPETGAIFHRILPPARLRHALAPDEGTHTEASLQV